MARAVFLALERACAGQAVLHQAVEPGSRRTMLISLTLPAKLVFPPFHAHQFISLREGYFLPELARLACTRAQSSNILR